MQLWKLERIEEDGPIWDANDGFVIRAPSEEEARALAASAAVDEGAEAWTDPQRSICKPLTQKGDAEIILRDFHAG